MRFGFLFSEQKSRVIRITHKAIKKHNWTGLDSANICRLYAFSIDPERSSSYKIAEWSLLIHIFFYMTEKIDFFIASIKNLFSQLKVSFAHIQTRIWLDQLFSFLSVEEDCFQFHVYRVSLSVYSYVDGCVRKT